MQTRFAIGPVVLLWLKAAAVRIKYRRLFMSKLHHRTHSTLSYQSVIRSQGLSLLLNAFRISIDHQDCHVPALFHRQVRFSLHLRSRGYHHHAGTLFLEIHNRSVYTMLIMTGSWSPLPRLLGAWRYCMGHTRQMLPTVRHTCQLDWHLMFGMLLLQS